MSMPSQVEIESIRQFDTSAEEFISHEQDVHTTIGGENKDSINNEFEEINGDSDAAIFHNDNTGDKLVLESRSATTSTNFNDEQSTASSTTPQSILKSTDDARSEGGSTITFTTLEIREYKITLGDNPGGSHGPPISLDWDYRKSQTQVTTLDEYEDSRPPRRSRPEMHIANDIRQWTLLREKGFSLREINKASKAAELVRIQRKKSTRKTPLSGLKKRVERMMNS